MLKVTLLTGKAGVGKDTYAKKLRAVRVALADPLKEECKRLGWDGVKDAKGRKFLQELGDVARDYYIDVFVDKAIEQIHDLFVDGSGHVVVTDCRYDNEVLKIIEEFRTWSFVEVELVELVREFESSLDPQAQEHPSEQGISDEVKALVNYRKVILDEEVNNG